MLYKSGRKLQVLKLRWHQTRFISFNVKWSTNAIGGPAVWFNRLEAACNAAKNSDVWQKMWPRKFKYLNFGEEFALHEPIRDSERVDDQQVESKTNLEDWLLSDRFPPETFYIFSFTSKFLFLFFFSSRTNAGRQVVKLGHRDASTAESARRSNAAPEVDGEARSTVRISDWSHEPKYGDVHFKYSDLQSMLPCRD